MIRSTLPVSARKINCPIVFDLVKRNYCFFLPVRLGENKVCRGKITRSHHPTVHAFPCTTTHCYCWCGCCNPRSIYIVAALHTIVNGYMYMYNVCTVKPCLGDHPTVQAKAVVKSRWSLEPDSTVCVCRTVGAGKTVFKSRWSLNPEVAYTRFYCTDKHTYNDGYVHVHVATIITVRRSTNMYVIIKFYQSNSRFCGCIIRTPMSIEYIVYCIHAACSPGLDVTWFMNLSETLPGSRDHGYNSYSQVSARLFGKHRPFSASRGGSTFPKSYTWRVSACARGCLKGNGNPLLPAFDMFYTRSPRWIPLSLCFVSKGPEPGA